MLYQYQRTQKRPSTAIIEHYFSQIRKCREVLWQEEFIKNWHWLIYGMMNRIKLKIYLTRAEEYAQKSIYIVLDKDIYRTAQEYYTKKKGHKKIFFAVTEKKDSLFFRNREPECSTY